MRLSLVLPDFAYNLAWSNRRGDETISNVVARALQSAFNPKPRPVDMGNVPVAPLLTWVEVIDE